MQEILIKKLHDYIGQNNPDVLISLQSEGEVDRYLKGKLSSVDTLLNELIAEGAQPFFIEEICMDALTADLRPSRFNYVASILQEEFEPVHGNFQNGGILKYEIVNMLNTCNPVFESMQFSERNADSPLLHYAIAGAISEYLDLKKRN